MHAHVRGRLHGAARQYSLALGAAALALALRQLLPQAGGAGPYVLALTAVAVSARYGGLGPGALAALLVTLAGAYPMLPPSAAQPSTAWLPRGLLFAEGLTLSLLISSLHTSLRRAEDALRERDAMLAVAAHELKTPLTMIIGYTQTLQMRAAREGHLDRRDQETLRVIAGQAKRLQALIDSILDLTRLQNGQTQIVRQAVDLADMARRVADDAGLGAGRHAVAFHGPDTPVMIEGDRVRLEHALRNLMDNAVKYSPAGGEITVCVEHGPAAAALSVSDQGIGIPEEARAHLFDRFYRADNVDLRRTPGTGIGLAVAAETVALHGGAIEVASVEGQGSTFTIRLPLRHNTPPAEMTSGAPRRLSDTPSVPTRTIDRRAAPPAHKHAR